MAEASQAQAQKLYRSLDDQVGEANVLADLGARQTLTGDYQAATTSLVAALELCRHLDSRIADANARSALGIVQTLTGRRAPQDAARPAIACETLRPLILSDPLAEPAGLPWQRTS